MSEVLRRRPTNMAREKVAIFLVAIFCCMSYLPMAKSSPNKEVDVDIGLGPNGISDRYSVNVPDGDVVSNISLRLLENVWPVNEVLTLQDKLDWSTGYSMDGIDYNSSGLRVLPMSYDWDFEGTTQGWNLDPQGGWSHGYDSTLGSVSGVNSGAFAIYTYNGDYPNYMGGPFWATSPVIDCSACSGTWDLKFWKRLGVESQTYDKAYVSVKNGNNWVNIYSNPYSSINDNSYVQSTYDVSTYITGNSAFQVRFGLGPTDVSQTYTGWNVDDITLEPRGNTGNGMANWTSESFGPEGVMKTNHGMMSIDATITQGSLVRWSLIDANDGLAIPGFTDREDMQVDLSVIDETSYPSLRLRITMESTGDSPVINSIKLGGGLIESFSADPSERGWSGFTSHSNGVVSGTNSLVSPGWRFINPFSGLNMDYVSTGSGIFQACFVKSSECTSSNWIDIPSDGKYNLEYPSVYLKLRWQGTGSYTFDKVSVDLLRQSSPENARIDVGLDGVNEWAFGHENIGPWGIQNLFDNGKESVQTNLSSEVPESLNIYFPYSPNILNNINGGSNYQSTGSMSFTLTPVSYPMANVELSVIVDEQKLLDYNVGLLSKPTTVTLSDSQMSDLITSINNRSGDIKILGDLFGHKLHILVKSTMDGSIIASGLSIPYRYEAQISGEESVDLVSSINAQLAVTSPQSGSREVAIPVVMDKPGSVAIHEYAVETVQSPLPVRIHMTNHTDTLVAGDDYYEFSSVFDLSNLQVSDAQSYFEEFAWSSAFVLIGSHWTRSSICSLPSQTCSTESGIIMEKFEYEFNGSQVIFYHRLQISLSWPEEEALMISSSINMEGISSQPLQLRFGSGWNMGVERDIEVLDWYLSFSDDARSDWNAMYFDPINSGIVKVKLAFENLEDSPRSSSLEIKLHLNGIEVDSTQKIVDGLATLAFTSELSAQSIDISVDVIGLYGQNINWKVPDHSTFELDDVSPILLSSNVNTLDHRNNNQPIPLVFEVGDRPALPRHAKLHVNSTWGGHEQIDLNLPENLNNSQGEYSTLIDLSESEIGDSFSGWLEIFDPAGHSLVGSGSENQPLFIIQLGPDGSPSLVEGGIESTNLDSWLHPGQNYSLKIPIHDVNGYGDIHQIRVDMSAESNENMTIIWSHQNGCISSQPTIILIDCIIDPNTHHFDEYFNLDVSFSFGWDFNPDSSIERSIMITSLDDSGQSFSSDTGLVWRYSSEIEIDTESVKFDGSSAYLAPGDNCLLVADVVWSKGKQPVDTTLEILAGINDSTQYGNSNGGIATINLTAPNKTGIHEITLDIINLPAGGIDRTNSQAIVAWMVVDGVEPRVSQFLSPNPANEVEERDWENLMFEILVNESQGLDIESLKLQWLLLPHGIPIPELALLSGNESLNLIAGTGAGISIPLSATINIDSRIPEISRDSSWDLWVWVEGQDLAGHEIESNQNSRSSPLAILQLASREAELSVDSSDIILSSRYLNVDESTTINVTVRNSGQVSGTTAISVEVVEDGNKRRLLESTVINVPAQSSLSFSVKWIPNTAGASWIEVSTPSGIFERTSPVQVDDIESDNVVDGFEGADKAMVTGFGIIIFLMVGLLGYLLISVKPDDEIENLE